MKFTEFAQQFKAQFSRIVGIKNEKVESSETESELLSALETVPAISQKIAEQVNESTSAISQDLKTLFEESFKSLKETMSESIEKQNSRIEALSKAMGQKIVEMEVPPKPANVNDPPNPGQKKQKSGSREYTYEEVMNATQAIPINKF